MATSNISQSFFERHQAKIMFGGSDECWLWTAGKFSRGYGAVRWGQKTWASHRVAYEAANGRGSASGFVVRHKCDTPACVNPGHLEIGTQADNIRDKMERGRHKTPKGSSNGLSKLTENDVVAIRAEYVRGSANHNQLALAKKYGVASSLISRIISRHYWVHV